MRAIVAFRSEGFVQSWPLTDATRTGRHLDRIAHGFYWRRSAAEALRSVPPSPLRERVVGHFYGECRQFAFSLFVHWAPLRSFPGDWWVVQIARRAGLLHSVSGHPPDAGVAEFSEKVGSVLESSHGNFKYSVVQSEGIC